MTADTTALQERVAEELYYDQHPEGRHRSEWPVAVYPDTVHEYRDLAAAVLPIIAAEVRAAKAEALREAVEKYAITIPDALGYKVPAVTVEDLMDAADEPETGDQA